MGLRNWLKKLERGARDDLDSFELLDGSRYYYDPRSTTVALYTFCYNCLGAGNPPDWPEPPELLVKVCEAKDARVAFEAVMGGSTDSFTYDDIFPFDAEVLINERRLEPRSLIAGRDVNDQAVPDLSEP